MMYYSCYLILLYNYLLFVGFIDPSWITLTGPSGMFNISNLLSTTQNPRITPGIQSNVLIILQPNSTTSQFTPTASTAEVLRESSENTRESNKLEHENEITTVYAYTSISDFDSIETNYTFETWIHRNSVDQDVSWRLHEQNTTNLEITLHPPKDLEFFNQSRIRVQFELLVEQDTRISYCDTNNLTCGPILEVLADLNDSNPQEVILEIKINISKYVSNTNHQRWTCVYWSETDGKWRSDGLKTIIDGQYVKCLSTHLTLFSVLLDPINFLHSVEKEKLSRHHDRILNTISIVGSTVSIPAILLTIGPYIYRKSQITETTKILIQSCIALLLTHICYHLYHWIGQKINCSLMNFMSHFSVSAFLSWSACDGINMWRMLFEDIFNTRGDVFYRRSTIISWGLPLITSAIGILVTDFPDDSCQLRFDQVCEILLFAIPSILILSGNLFLFFCILIKVICKDSLSRLRNKKIDFVIALAQVFNMAWCVSFPLLWFSQTRLTGQYLFSILVSTQGVLFYIVRSPKDFHIKQVFDYKSFVSPFTCSQIRMPIGSTFSYSVSDSIMSPKRKMLKTTNTSTSTIGSI